MQEWEIRVTNELLAWIDTWDERILFVFDPWRSAILLTGGDKSGNWSGWYKQAIPQAEDLYEEYVKERQIEEELR